jgi:carboxyl-terminal processing protease
LLISDYVEAVDFSENPGHKFENDIQAEKELKVMIAGLRNPANKFLEVSEYRIAKARRDGEIVGIGLNVQFGNNSNLNVIRVVIDSPAFKVGIRARDRILSVDGISVDSTDHNSLLQKLSGGSSGDLLKLVLERKGKKYNVEVRKTSMIVKNVEVETLPGNFAYVKLHSFSGTAFPEFLQVLRAVDHQDGMVLDLRGNEGGSIHNCLRICSTLLEGDKPCVFVYSKGHQMTQEGSFVPNQARSTNKPLVVLIDRQSACETEVLAHVLKVNHRATLVGTPSAGETFHKELFDLSDGYALQIATAQYSDSYGKKLVALPVMPDVVVNDEFKQLSVAMKELAAKAQIERSQSKH